MKNNSTLKPKPIDIFLRNYPEAITSPAPTSPLSGNAGLVRMTNGFSVANRLREDPAEFRARFSRCYRLLHFIACRVLGGPEQADDAIENCRRTASRNLRRFEYEGAFRSWLVRVLIDEALALLREATL
jgi:hypothetical protein